MLPALGRLRRVRVSLDVDTVPAIYSVVHGTQLAEIEPGRTTRVDLAVTPLISITGLVVCKEADGSVRPVTGVRVYLVNADTGEIGVDSITASDGSYYLGDIKPGTYVLHVDQATIPEAYEAERVEQRVTVAVQKEFQEIALDPLVCRRIPNTNSGK